MMGEDMESLKIYKSRRYVDAMFLTMALNIQKFGVNNICFFTILKGGLYTAHSVINNLSWKNPFFGYLGLSSYHDNIRASEIEVTYDNDLNEDMVTDKDIWVIDDISDSGKTLDYAKGLIESFHPRSFRTAVLVDKIKNRESNHFPKPDVVGFIHTGNEFLVGAGMGYGEKYRHLRELYELVLE
ncbi:MAG: phosphoribosyltransferase [Candidatus Heimdallarchaeaceae archaeon]